MDDLNPTLTGKKRKQRIELNDSYRLKIIRRRQSEKISNRALAREFNVDEKTIRLTLASKDITIKRSMLLPEPAQSKIIRVPRPKFPELETDLHSWIEIARRRKVDQRTYGMWQIT